MRRDFIEQAKVGALTKGVINVGGENRLDTREDTSILESIKAR